MPTDRNAGLVANVALIIKRGRKHSPETKAKLSACRTGIPLYPEHKAKIRASKVGKPWSDARRAAQELRKKKKKGD